MQDFLVKAKSKLNKSIPEDFTHKANVEHADKRSYRQAAVLIAITDKPKPSIILTRRPLHMKTHAGEVAFPGGKLESFDVDAKHAALREADEEIGLKQQYVDVLGYLDTYKVGSGFNVCPVVAVVSKGYNLTADPNEVDEIFEVPLDFLMDVNNFQRHSKMWQGKQRHYYVIEYKNYFIWGATADMLKNLHDKLYI